MPTEVFMSQRGMTMTEGALVHWLKWQGEQVNKVEAIFEAGTGKTAAEVEAVASGSLSGESASAC